MKGPDGVVVGPFPCALTRSVCAMPTSASRLGVPGMVSFETLQLYTATTLRGFCRLARDRSGDTGLAAVPRGADAAATVEGGSLAYLTHVLVKDGETPQERRSEFVVHACGPAGPVLAERMAACVRAWDRKARRAGYPLMTVHPANPRSCSPHRAHPGQGLLQAGLPMARAGQG